MGYDWRISAKKAAAVVAFGALMTLGHYLSDEHNAREVLPQTVSEVGVTALVAVARYLDNWSKHRLPPTSVDEVPTRPVLNTEAEQDAFVEAYANLRRLKVPWEEARRRALDGVLSARDIR